MLLAKANHLGRLWGLLSLLSVTACGAVGPDFTTPVSKTEAEWVGYTPATVEAEKQFEPAWWEQFNDPGLDALIEAARDNSPTLQAAGVRVVQSMAQYDIAVGQLFPQTQALEGQLNYRRLDGDFVDLIPGLDRDIFTANIGLGASWEIDLWGKFRRQIEAGNADFLSSVASYDDALVSLIANVAESYITIRTLEERIAVAEENALLQAESFRIARVRFENGETSELDVRQAQVQLARTRSQIPAFQESLQQSKNTLAILIGETPGNVEPYLSNSLGLPQAPEELFTGIPRDLLRRRPDIREAEFTAASQSALIGAAEANLYPAFTLSGMFGFAASTIGPGSLGDIFQWDNSAPSASAGLVFPIFNYGRLVNQVRVQDAEFQQAVLNYQNAVLNAQKEVEDALASYRYSNEQSAFLSEATSASKRSADLSVLQYKAGAVDFTTVLTSAQSRLDAEDSFIVAQDNVLQAVISTYRALGGGWKARSGQPFISTEIREAMSQRTSWDEKLDAQSEDLFVTEVSEVTVKAVEDETPVESEGFFESLFNFRISDRSVELWQETP